jgi:dTDP-4-dehydrorhamnose 3,5-epimerase
MRFNETRIGGVYVIELEPIYDERGSFVRTWCAREFGEMGLMAEPRQSSFSISRKRGTLRGLHYQRPPHEEAKLVRCTRGRLYDVVLDLRKESASFGRHVGIHLARGDMKVVYVPEGCAHGFLTLEDDTEVCYQMSEFYEPAATAGVRWNDPRFHIEWPGEVTVISDRDRSHPDFPAA